MKRRSKILISMGVFILFAACLPRFTPIQSNLLQPTNTPQPTITSRPTIFSTPTIKPSSTLLQEPRYLEPIRPVDEKVPIYHTYDQPIQSLNIPRYGHNHQGYDYGFDNCNPITYDVIAIESGEVMQLGGDEDVWIDHGLVRLTNGETWRVMSTYYHTQFDKSLRLGQMVEKGQMIAHFVGCDSPRSPEGKKFNPELELSIKIADPIETKNLKGESLMIYLINKQFNVLGNFTYINPSLIGLPAK